MTGLVLLHGLGMFIRCFGEVWLRGEERGNGHGDQILRKLRMTMQGVLSEHETLISEDTLRFLRPD
jgi:hypothetical protein